MSSVILEVNGVSAGYESFCLDNINFKVEKGDMLGIIGPNGSGKTTILRTLTRILKLKRGDILYQGKSIAGTSFKELSKTIAVVSQNPEVSHLTVEEFVLLGRIPHFKKFQFFESSYDLKIALKNIELTGISDFRYKQLGELSGGERQLAFIARALCQEPELILLDEPTTYLDITHQVGILDTIKRLNRDSGLTVIMVIHDLNLASEYCNHLILMNNGKIHSKGKPKQVLNYKTIEEVYQTVVLVKINPISDRPYVFLVSEEYRKKLP